MNESKRYYWIKLKTDFFNQETIDFLLSQKNGCEYIVLYQMLCLNTANNNGEMCSKIGEMIVPYDVDKIVRDTKHFDFDTVTIALGLFKKLGLIYEEENKILKIANFTEMVGSEAANANAQRQKRFRERQKQLKLSVTNSNGDSNDSNVTENNEEIEIDIRDKDIDIKKEINKESKKESKKETFDDLISDFIAPDGKNMRFINSAEIRELLQEWLKVRKSKRAAMTNKAIELNLKKLDTLANESNMSIATYLEEVIARGWTAFYKINNYDKQNTSNNYKRVEPVPAWLNTEIKQKQAAPEKKKVMDDLLKEYKPNPELQARLKSKYGQNASNIN